MMLLVPNDTRRRGAKTTEFWLCTVCSTVIAAATVIFGSGVMAVAATVPVSVYCVCRTIVKSRAGIDPDKLDERPGL